MKKTKIICTLGPACRDEKILTQMFQNGMNVARVNMSHGTHEYHRETIALFRRVRDSLGLSAAVMLDTKGPEIRIGDFQNQRIVLNPGDDFTLTSEDILGDEKHVSVLYKELPSQMAPGNSILIDDGRVSMKVTECSNTEIHCRVVHGGELTGHKGVNIPNIHLEMPYLSDADKEDILFGISEDVDFIAASFTRTAEDVIALRKFINYHGGHDIKIISKIENNEGIKNFDEILALSDGIMVARGDMGVEIEYYRLPGIQKKFIKKCYQSGKMVITATQMLESMIHSASPTRAEITDVANAVFDGTSAIMLSGESAVGEYPARVVKVMANIAEQAELDAFEMQMYFGVQYDNDVSDITNAICDAACTTARDVKAKAIIAVTKSGLSARRVSKFRPYESIIAATPVIKTFHQLSLSWGVFPILALNQQDADELFRHAVDCAVNADLISAGDKVVITAGVPLNVEGTTNILKVHTVDKAMR